MTAELKQQIQIVLIIAIAVAAVRAGWIFYQRHEQNQQTQAQKQPAAGSLNPDYYVTPKKLHAYDLESARELTRQPVWVKEGYRYSYYSYDSSSRKPNLSHEAGCSCHCRGWKSRMLCSPPLRLRRSRPRSLPSLRTPERLTRFTLGSSLAGTTRSTRMKCSSFRIPRNSTSTGQRIFGARSKSTKSSPA